MFVSISLERLLIPATQTSDSIQQAIKKPPSRAVDLYSLAANAIFVKVMHVRAVQDTLFSL
jgi:hypothetical protein